MRNNSLGRAVLTHGPNGHLFRGPTSIGPHKHFFIPVNNCHKSPSVLPCPGAHSAIKTALILGRLSVNKLACCISVLV